MEIELEERTEKPETADQVLVPKVVQVPEEFVRFRRIHRMEHWAVMFLFTGLVITGLPQSYAESRIAQWIVNLLGGIDWSRWIHRVFGILFAALAVWHLGRAIWSVTVQKGRAHMIPTSRDFRDAVESVRYYLRRTDEYPRFDRYDFRQKFEYIGMVMGSLVMIVTGFLLMFPIFFTKYIPGVLIPVAKITHGYEALLALSVILIWHMYGAHLNPDVFPMDKTIFTGNISRERMEKEHPIEMQRILESMERKTEEKEVRQ
jgi:cytochrome b subunit of formate dehydrogenase